MCNLNLKDVVVSIRTDGLQGYTAVLKPEYSIDGCRILYCDSATSNLAKKYNATWKTINGAKVLIDKSNNIIAGLGGKFQNVNQIQAVSNNFQYDANSSMTALEQIATMNGFMNKPILLDEDEFEKAMKDSGYIAMKTFNEGVNGLDGKVSDGMGFKKRFLNDEVINYRGRYNHDNLLGICFDVNREKPRQGELPDLAIIKGVSKRSSFTKGNLGESGTVVATFPKDFKTIRQRELWEQWNKQTDSVKQKYNRPEAYAAALGFDAMVSVGDEFYVFNRSKILVLNAPNENKFTEAYKYR